MKAGVKDPNERTTEVVKPELSENLDSREGIDARRPEIGGQIACGLIGEAWMRAECRDSYIWNLGLGATHTEQGREDGLDAGPSPPGSMGDDSFHSVPGG